MSNPMASEETPSTPAHWLALAEALRVPLDGLRAGPPAPTRRMKEDDFLAFVSEQLDDLDDWIARIGISLTPLEEVVKAEQAGARDIDRATERVTRLTDELMGNYCLLRDLRVRFSEEEGRAAFTRVYEHLLKEMTMWLQSLVQLLETPAAELRRRQRSRDGKGQPSVTVALSSPADLKTLRNWAHKEATRRKRRKLWALLVPRMQLLLLRFLSRLLGGRR